MKFNLKYVQLEHHRISEIPLWLKSKHYTDDEAGTNDSMQNISASESTWCKHYTVKLIQIIKTRFIVKDQVFNLCVILRLLDEGEPELRLKFKVEWFCVS